MISKQGKKTIIDEFDSYKVPHIYRHESFKESFFFLVQINDNVNIVVCAKSLN